MYSSVKGVLFGNDFITLLHQLGMQARAPISALMRGKDLPNLGAELSIFSFTPTNGALAPCVIPTLRDVQNPAHDNNGKRLFVMINKLIFHRCSREKMLTTFFRISRS